MNIILDIALAVAGFLFGCFGRWTALRVYDVAKNLYRIEKERVKDWLQGKRTEPSWFTEPPPNFCLWCNADIRGKIGQFCSTVCAEQYERNGGHPL